MNAVPARTTTGYDLVIFDCDGVLIDSEVLSCKCLMELLQRHGIDVELEGVSQRFLGRSIAAVAAHFHPSGRAMPAGFPAELSRLVRDSFARSLQAMPGIKGVLETLATPYCVASSSDLERIS